MINDTYSRWDDNDAVEHFAAKTASDFFETEIRFLDPIARNLSSVLDIGCASGRFAELLASLGVFPAYCGMDISSKQIASARELYPQADFHLGNALELTVDGVFDLVNATGVMQHEPRFSELIERMIAWSRRYVLFDVKLSTLEEDIIDKARASAGTPEHPLHFNILSTNRLLDRLEHLTKISRVEVFGYETIPNRNTTVPQEVSRLASAGVFLEIGNGPARPHVDLPKGFVS